jgi:hypothetical protein
MPAKTAAGLPSMHAYREASSLAASSAGTVDRKHVLSIMVEPNVVSSAKPTHLKRLVILVVMCVNSFNSADFAGFLVKLTGTQSTLNSKVGIVFSRIGAAPVRLSCFALDRHFAPVDAMSLKNQRCLNAASELSVYPIRGI